MTDPTTQDELPLAGVRVLDLSHFEAGPSSTQMLAWLGADVIKVEPPGRGEQGRTSSQDVPGADSIYFLMLNSNKRSITLNLKSDHGREIFLDLVRSSDVIVENYGPGTMARLGFSYERLAEANPGIIYASIKGYGTGTRYENFLSFDPIAQAVGGATSVTGESPDRQPLRPGPTMADTGAGLHTAIGILAALHGRARSGLGQAIEVTLQESVINFCRVSYVQQTMTGKAAVRAGNELLPGANAPNKIYPCDPQGPNDYVHIYCARGERGDQHWARLLEVIGRDDLVGDPRYATPQARNDNVDEVDQIVAAWTVTRSKQDVMRLLGEAGIPAGAVYDTMELSHDPDLRRREMFVDVEHPDRPDYVTVGNPIKMSRTPFSVRRAPLLGEHTTDVLAELGFDDEAVDKLRADGVL